MATLAATSPVPTAISSSSASSASASLSTRNIREDDCAQILPVMDQWWGGRHVADMLPKLFFIHFRDTSFAIEDPKTGKVVAFIIGFVSQTHPTQAYVHFAGVHPDYRKRGLARHLYDTFSHAVSELGCRTVHCATSTVNRASIAFHQAVGFALQPGDSIANGIPVASNYDGRGLPRVLFVKELP